MREKGLLSAILSLLLWYWLFYAFGEWNCKRRGMYWIEEEKICRSYK
jgi:hypothetical protein